jgi:hypothetical protein
VEDLPKGGEEQRVVAADKGKNSLDHVVHDVEMMGNQSAGEGKNFEVGESSTNPIDEVKTAAEITALGVSNQGSSNLGDNVVNLRGQNEKEEDKSLNVVAGKPHESIFCHRCKVVCHYTKEYRRIWQRDKEDHQMGKREQNLSECVATLCAAQVEGLAFFCIPNRPSMIHSRERVNTAIITVLKGSISAKQLEDEFTRIMSRVWRWTEEGYLTTNSL